MAENGGRRLRLGISGLGRGFSVMLPTLAAHPLLDVAAASDTRPEACARFEADFGGRGYDTVEALCADDSLDAIYVATPHQFHAEHAVAAARAGRHVLVEKPMALTLDECTRMIDAAGEAGVHLIVGHSHSFDAPVAETRRLIESGRYGAPRMITALNYTDFVYRPRRPEEMDRARGGGVVFSQAAHQIDIVRLFGGGMVETVYAATGDWDAARSTDGAYSAMLRFEGGATASLAYSGYGRFDSDEFCGWIAESGRPKDPEAYGNARRALAGAGTAEAEAALKASRGYGGPAGAAKPVISDGRAHEHFGLFVVGCERADLRPLPDRVMIYGEDERKTIPLPPPAVPRAEVIDELHAAIVRGIPPVHTGEWGRATLEVCLALLRSADERREVGLSLQVPAAGLDDAS